MLGIVAAALFAIAYVINSTATSTNAWLTPTGLMLLGLVALALHLVGYGASWEAPRYRRRR
jgi:hypothetical protein